MMSAIKAKKRYLKFELLLMSLALSLTAPCMASNKFDQNYQPLKIEIISDNCDA